MKSILLPFLLLLASFDSFAQLEKEDIEIAQAIFGKNKKVIVADYMQINDSEHAFWKLYEEYEDRRKAISTERFNLLNRYALEYDSLTDASASKLAEGYIANSTKTNKLNKVYFKKFEKIVGGLKAATLFQIETYIQTAVQANLQNEIPVIGELRKVGSL